MWEQTLDVVFLNVSGEAKLVLAAVGRYMFCQHVVDGGLGSELHDVVLCLVTLVLRGRRLGGLRTCTVPKVPTVASFSMMYG